MRYLLFYLCLQTSLVVCAQEAPTPPMPPQKGEGQLSIPAVPPIPSLSLATPLPQEKGVKKISSSSIGSSYELEYSGRITTSNDDKDITAISDNGFFKYSKTVFGTSHRVEITAQGSQLEKRYYKGRKEADWESEGKKWLAEILPELVLNSAVASESRVDRFYQQGGSKAVINEMQRLKNDFTRITYFEHLLKKKLTPAEEEDVYAALVRLVSSDYYLASLLERQLKNGLSSPTANEGFLRALSKMNSDFYKASVLQKMLSKNAGNNFSTEKLLLIIAGMGSDFYKAGVLEDLVKAGAAQAYQQQYFAAAATINSDFYAAAAISKGLSHFELTNLGLYQAIQAWQKMNSDFYQADVMVKLLKKHRLTSESQKIVLQPLGKSINSDLYLHDILQAFAKNQSLNVPNFSLWLDATGHIDSDFYKASALNGFQKENINEAQLAGILVASANIKSDFYKADVLTKYSKQAMQASSTVKEAYKLSANSIQSAHYRNQVMEAIKE